jgi:hypothetical protein
MAEVQISRDAVEAAARALVNSGVVPGKTWDDLQPGAKFLWAQRAKHMLDAAAPPLASGQRVIDCTSICIAIGQDERAQADAADPEVHRPSAEFLAGYRAATERAQEVVREWTVEAVRAQA